MFYIDYIADICDCSEGRLAEGGGRFMRSTGQKDTLKPRPQGSKLGISDFGEQRRFFRRRGDKAVRQSGGVACSPRREIGGPQKVRIRKAKTCQHGKGCENGYGYAEHPVPW
jgi:hypothetical protein